MVFVCLYQINVKTAKPIQPKIFDIFKRENATWMQQLKYKIEGESEASLEA